MKQILSLFMFGIGALLFLAFFTSLKPAVVTAASGPVKPGQLQHERSTCGRVPLIDICYSTLA
jgi:hypothetical protein